MATASGYPDSFDCETLLRRAIDYVATAKTMPLSSTPMVNRDELLEMLDGVVERMPEELREARFLLREREEFLEKTKRESEDLLEAARAQAERMVQRTEVVRAAEHRARQILDAANDDARRMRHEIEDFCDRRLASFEIALERIQKTVATAREKLNINPMREQEPQAGPPHDAAGGFFDQDRP